ncbi:hypothetical protein HDU97_003483 [Phlyctochytrium planicorne]|nr:hypothetical protein HDU97_003483 [Phlyctochytrium planicorne]
MEGHYGAPPDASLPRLPAELMIHLLHHLPSRTDLLTMSRISKSWRNLINAQLFTTLAPTSLSQLVSLSSNLWKSRRWHELHEHGNDTDNGRDGLDPPMIFVKALDFSGLKGLKSKLTDQMFRSIMDALSPAASDNAKLCKRGASCPRACIEKVNLADCFQLTNESLFILLERHGDTLEWLDISYCNMMTISPGTRASKMFLEGNEGEDGVSNKRRRRGAVKPASHSPTFHDVWPSPALSQVGLTIGSDSGGGGGVCAWAVSRLIASNTESSSSSSSSMTARKRLQSLWISVVSDKDPWPEILHQINSSIPKPVAIHPPQPMLFLSLSHTRLQDAYLSNLLQTLLPLHATGSGGIQTLDVRGERTLSSKSLIECIEWASGSPPTPISSPLYPPFSRLTSLDVRGCNRLTYSDTLHILTITGRTLLEFAVGPKFHNDSNEAEPRTSLFAFLTVARFLAAKPKACPNLHTLFLAANGRHFLNASTAIGNDTLVGDINMALGRLLERAGTLRRIGIVVEGWEEKRGGVEETRKESPMLAYADVGLCGILAAGTPYPELEVSEIPPDRQEDEGAVMRELVLHDLNFWMPKSIQSNAMPLSATFPSSSSATLAQNPTFSNPLANLTHLTLYHFDETKVEKLCRLLATTLTKVHRISLIVSGFTELTIIQLYNFIKECYRDMLGEKGHEDTIQFNLMTVRQVAWYPLANGVSVRILSQHYGDWLKNSLADTFSLA